MKKITLALNAFVMALTFVFVPTTVHADESIAMYRVYNPNSGEHFYTANLKRKR